MFASPPLLEWMSMTSVFAFLAMGADKYFAIASFRRVSERTLWLAALVGVFAGILAGGYVFRHKTSTAEFWPPVVVAAMVWVAAIMFLRIAV